MDADPPFDLAWYQLARRWGLPSTQLSQAVTYLYTVLYAAEGFLQPVELQYRPEGARYVFRYTDPAMEGQQVVVDRPAGWDEQDELQAIADLLSTLARMQDDEGLAA